ncbi:hypothetical protein BN2537_17277 [Streptomyces venezuelae]|nr:hypothetical protein BN2537_17277 [Streptomyces venezuelae]
MGAFEKGVAALTQYKDTHRLRDRPKSPRRAAGGWQRGPARGVLE